MAIFGHGNRNVFVRSLLISTEGSFALKLPVLALIQVHEHACTETNGARVGLMIAV